MTSVAAEIATLPALAKALRLPAIARCCESRAATAEAEAWPCSRTKNSAAAPTVESCV